MEKTDEELQMLAGSVADLEWYRKNLDDIQIKFNGKAVAIKEKEVIGSSVDAQTLLEQLDKRGVDSDLVLIKRVIPKGETVIF